MDDFDRTAAVIHEWVPSEADLIISLVMDESMGGNVKVTILAGHISSGKGIRISTSRFRDWNQRRDWIIDQHPLSFEYECILAISVRILS